MERLLSIFGDKSNRLKELRMKRLLSVFSLAAMLLELALPHSANANCVNADGTGVQIGDWPSHQYTQRCGNSSKADGTDMFSAFSPWFANDAFARLTFQHPIFYLFNSPSQFQSAGIMPAEVFINPTVNFGDSFIPLGYTVVVEDTDTTGNPPTVTTNYEIPNVTAHEAGHWVDYLYEHAPNAINISIGGTKTTGNTVSITVHSSKLAGGVEKATYTVGEEDTLADIATGLAGAVNFDTNLNTATIHIIASAANTNVSVSAVLPSGSPYSAYTTAGTTYTLSKSGGATETISGIIGVLPGNGSAHASDSILFTDELAQDWINFNALSPCAGDAGIFSGRQDKNLAYICTGALGVGGTLSATYSGLTNKAVLQTVWPDIFNAPAPNTNNEIFVEEFASLLSKTDGNYTEGGNPPPPTAGTTNPRSRDYYFSAQNSFQCTQNLISTMTSTGILPSGYPGNCPNH
jgi:hypothetical protein